MKGRYKGFEPEVAFPLPFETWDFGQRVAYNDGEQYLFGRVVGVHRYFIRVHFDAGYDSCFLFFDAERELERFDCAFAQ